MLDGYTELVTDRGRAGWSCHLVTILFSQLPGPRSAVIARMRDEVQRVYSTLLTRVHRKPRKATADELPVLVAAWIYPSTSGTGVGSDGPLQRRASCPRFDDDAADVPTEGVARRPHPEASKSLCRSRKVRPAGPRPSVVEDHQRVVDYVLKTVLNGWLSYDEAVVLLPRSRGEPRTGLVMDRPGNPLGLADRLSTSGRMPDCNQSSMPSERRPKKLREMQRLKMTV